MEPFTSTIRTTPWMGVILDDGKIFHYYKQMKFPCKYPKGYPRSLKKMSTSKIMAKARSMERAASKLRRSGKARAANHCLSKRSKMLEKSLM